MREILFRGKDEGTKKWVQGYYLEGATRHCITCSLAYYPRYDVIPETIGQYTGLTDKNGKKIFEGDIVMFGLAPCVIKYEVENARFMLYENGKHLRNGFNVDTMKLKEIIGNIHDNPELLGGDTK